MVKIAVVILNYNGRHFLEKFLQSVIERSPGASIVVADNKSTDDSIGFLKAKFPTVELITLKKNYGYAGGYNQALTKVKAQYYVLLNSDVEVSHGWLDPLTQFMDANEAYASCQPKIKGYEYRDKFEYAGACGGFIDMLGYPYCRGRIFDYTEADDGQYDDQIDIFWSSGACMMIRSDDFHAVGAFDDSFFAHMEEIDLCWRLQSSGKKIRVIPESVVYHVGGGTLSYQSPFKTYLNFRNGLKLLIKNLPTRRLLLKLPIRVVLDWLAALVFLLQGNWQHSKSVIMAHAYFLKHGAGNHSNHVRSTIRNSRMIVLDYFLRRKKTFN